MLDRICLTAGASCRITRHDLEQDLQGLRRLREHVVSVGWRSAIEAVDRAIAEREREVLAMGELEQEAS